MTDLHADALPGMPDRLAKNPPKSTDYSHYTLDQAIARSHELVDQALEQHESDRVLMLFSGGNDSTVLAHLMRDRADTVVHVNTTIGVQATHDYVRDVANAWGTPYIEAAPPRTYRDLVLGRVLSTRGDNIGRQVWKGFPGPAGHYLMYNRLKERALDKVRRQIIRDSGRTRGRTGQVMYLAGMRWGESQRRFRNANEIDVAGSVVWVSPIVHWTNDHMKEYRARHWCPEDHAHAKHKLCAPGVLPHNEVTDHLHMSGDCLCGAYAKEGEIHGLELFYPEVAAELHAIEQEMAVDPGLTDLPKERCTWGWGANQERPGRQAGRLCSSCEFPGQMELPDMPDAPAA